MNDSKNLIVFYSRTETTRRVAEAIRSEWGGDLLEIRTDRYPPGARGYVRAAWDAIRENEVPIIIPEKILTVSYDCVIIGAPVWGGSLSGPVRSYMNHQLPPCKQLAFFLTHGSPSHMASRRVFTEMEKISGKKPAALLDVMASEVSRGSYFEKVKTFVASLKKVVEIRAA